MPPGYRLETTHNAGLVTGGLLTLGLAYAAGLTLALANDFENGATWLALPVAGPWAAIGARKVSCRVEPTGKDCLEVANSEIRISTAMALDGLVQVTGAVLVLAGLFSREKSLVRQDVAAFELTPALSTSELGFLAKARF